MRMADCRRLENLLEICSRESLLYQIWSVIHFGMLKDEAAATDRNKPVFLDQIIIKEHKSPSILSENVT